MATKIKIYNGALREIGERQTTLTEDREPRRIIDEVYADALEFCLEQGFWNFAMRTVQIDSNPSVNTSFGYQFVFDKPNDWVRTVSLSADEYGYSGLEEYRDETDYWLADIDPLYVRYISNDTSFGLDLSRWPGTFSRAVELYIAYLICERLTQNASKEAMLEKKYKKAIRNAKNKDAMNEVNANRKPLDTWAGSRGGSARNWRLGNYRAG